MTTQVKMTYQNSSSTRSIMVDLEETNILVKELMYENDLRSIPKNKISDVMAGLIQRAVKELCEHDLFTFTRTPSDPVKYEPYYFHDRIKDLVEFQFISIFPVYDETLLLRYYTAETLEEITQDLLYTITKKLYSIIPNTKFSHEVKVSLPHTGFIIAEVHEDDLEECHADDISDATDSGLHPEALLNGLYWN